MRRKRRTSENGTIWRPFATQSTRCGKLSYPTKKVAREKAAASAKMTGHLIEAYHCYGCHAYHIGHRPGSRA